MRSSFAFFLLLMLVLAISQTSSAQDTLSIGGFLNIVKKNHPVTQKAKLLGALAKARRTQAFGEFDPKIGVNYDRKLFDGTEYYTFLTPEVKLPLWFGMELKANYTEASGMYLNPENKVPSEGLSYAGLSIPLGKGLLLDKRRATWRQAQVFERASENEQVAMLNDLFMNAGESYVNWQNAYKIFSIYESAVKLSEVRLEAVRKAFKGGDKPAIDTAEALSQLQQRQIQLSQAKIDVTKALYDLSTFLWLDSSTPVDPDKLTIKPVGDILLNSLSASEVDNNPKLRSYLFKLQSLQIERRLKAENLRPELSVQLGVLNGGRNPLARFSSPYQLENNKIGVQFAFPLSLSTARGELAESKIKIRETELEQSMVKLELQNKLKQNDAEVAGLNEQILLLRRSLSISETLLRGEETKFRLGESSLFLINARESKVLEQNEKLLETEAKLKKAELKNFWIRGSLPEVF